MSTISLILITFNRKNDIVKTLESLVPLSGGLHEIIVVNNGSEDGTGEALAAFPSRIPGLRILDAGKNLGVAGGRNFGIRNATGDILVFLDDDAEFLTADFVALTVERFRNNPRLGALAYKVVNGKGQIRPNEFPHPDKKKPADAEFPTAYFVGAGHAIRAAALRETGLYPEEFFYSQEELYLCYALVEKGYAIAYFPQVTILHWQSGAGRFANRRKWHLLLRNTLLVNHRFLPSRYFWASLPVWILKVLVLGRSTSLVYQALREFASMRSLPPFSRNPLRGEALNYLRTYGGRLLG